MSRTFCQSICIALMACGSSGSTCGGSGVTGSATSTTQEPGGNATSTSSEHENENELEEIQRSFPDGTEVRPFDGWSVPGMRLFHTSWSVPDRSSARIVGIDASGEIVRGVELMRHVGELPPRDLALRANAILLPFAGQEALSPGYAEWGSAQGQARIQEAHIEDGSLCYFAVQGEMNPGIVQRCVQLSDYSVTTRSVSEVILANGENVVDESVICVAHSSCGCWSGCVRAQRVQRPDIEIHAYQIVESGVILQHREDCYEGTCFEVCRSAGENAHCDAGTFEPLDMSCTGACAPSRADYHCETLESGCRVVQH